MRPQRRRNTFTSESGMATIEALPLLVIFVVLIAFTLGSFGVIHTGILNSIAARTYAFETFRHRTNLTYFRDSSGEPKHFAYYRNRVHGIRSESNSGDDFHATERSITMGMRLNETGRNENLHNEGLLDQIQHGQRATVDVNPAWVMIQYGICLDPFCGG